MILGLHSCKPGNEPVVGQTKTFTVENRTGKSGKPYVKIKSAPAEQGGTPYRIVSVKPTGHTDSYGNVSFNLGIEPAEGAPVSQPAAKTQPQTATGSARPIPERDDARHYMMRAANLLQLAHNAASAVLGPTYGGEDARTLFIQAARDGYVSQMPDKPMSAPEPESTPEPEGDEPF